MGYVYFIKHNRLSPVKIGMTDIIMSYGLEDVTCSTDRKKGKRKFSINEDGRFLLFDYVNISVFNADDFGLFHNTKITKEQLSKTIDFLTL